MATHRTHVHEAVTGTEVGADQMIHADEESRLFLRFPLRRAFGIFSPGHETARKDHTSPGKFNHEIAILLLDNHGGTAKWGQIAAQEHIERIEVEAGTSFEQIIEQSTHREDLTMHWFLGQTRLLTPLEETLVVQRPVSGYPRRRERISPIHVRR